MSQNTEKRSFYPATTLVFPEDGKEIINIETVRKTRQDCSLADTICHAKDGGETVVPIDVGILIDVDENENSDEDDRQSSL